MELARVGVGHVVSAGHRDHREDSRTSIAELIQLGQAPDSEVHQSGEVLPRIGPFRSAGDFARPEIIGRLQEGFMGDIAVRYPLRVKRRQWIVEYAQAHGIKPQGRHFGPDRRTVRRWLRRWVAGGEQGLVPRYSTRRKRRLPETRRELIRLARVDHGTGPLARRSG
jgi:hypothetical protein